MAQNWSNLLYYINSKLASNVNSLELTDADIQQIITNVTLPEFSTYNPHKTMLKIDPGMMIAGSLNRYTFRLPIAANNLNIVRVEEAFYSNANSNSLLSGVNTGLVTNPIDVALAAQSLDMRKSLQTTRTYEFFPPDVIAFNLPMTSSMILDLAVEHTSPITIQSDLYHKLFKKLAFRDILDNIIAIRSKYTTLSTPIGQIELNVDALIQLRDRLNDEIKEFGDNLPPDVMVTFL